MPRNKDEEILDSFLSEEPTVKKIEKKDTEEFQNDTISDEETLDQALSAQDLNVNNEDESFLEKAKGFLNSSTDDKLQMAKDFLNEKTDQLKTGQKNVINTALLGYGPELYGLGAELIPGGENYIEARKSAARNLRESNLRNPKSAFMGKVGGVFLPGLGTAATLGKALARIAGLKNLYQSGSILGGAVEGGASGGLYGLLENPGESDSEEISPIQAKERIKNAAVGTAGGLILGSLLAPVRRYIQDAQQVAREQEQGIFRAKAGQKSYSDIDEFGNQALIEGPPPIPPEARQLPPPVPGVPPMPRPPFMPEGTFNDTLPNLRPGRLPREILKAPGEVPGFVPKFIPNLVQKGMQDIEDVGTKLENTVVNAIPKYMSSTVGKFAPTMKQDEAVLIKNGIIKEGESMPPALLFGENSKANAKWLVSADSPADNFKKEYLHTLVGRINNSILDKIDDISGYSGDVSEDGKPIPLSYDKAEVGDYVADSFFEGVDRFFKKMEVTYENVGNLIEQNGAKGNQAQVQEAIKNIKDGIGLIVQRASQRNAKGGFVDKNGLWTRSNEESKGRGISVKDSQLNNIVTKANQIIADLVQSSKMGGFSPRKWLKDASFHIRDLGDVAFGLGESENDRDFHKRLLREMYGNLRNGIYKVVDAYDPKLKNDLQDVNNAVDTYYRTMGSFVDRIEKEKGMPGGAGEILMRKLTEGGNKEAYIIRDMMLEGGGDPDKKLGRIRAYYISQLIPDNRGENLTFQAIKNLRDKEQKINILFNTPKSQEKVKDLEELFETLSRIGKKTMNPSGTSISTRFTYNPLKIAEEEMMLDSDYAQAVAKAKRGVKPEELPIEHGGKLQSNLKKTNFLRSREYRRGNVEKAQKPLPPMGQELPPMPTEPNGPMPEDINEDQFAPEMPNAKMEKVLKKVQSYKQNFGNQYIDKSGMMTKAMEQNASKYLAPKRNEELLSKMIPGGIPPMTPKNAPSSDIERFSKGNEKFSTDDVDTIERFLQDSEDVKTSDIEGAERFSKDEGNYRTGEALNRKGWIYDKNSGLMRNGEFYHTPNKVGQRPNRIKKMNKKQIELENNGKKWWN